MSSKYVTDRITDARIASILNTRLTRRQIVAAGLAKHPLWRLFRPKKLTQGVGILHVVDRGMLGDLPH